MQLQRISQSQSPSLFQSVIAVSKGRLVIYSSQWQSAKTTVPQNGQDVIDFEKIDSSLFYGITVLGIYGYT